MHFLNATKTRKVFVDWKEIVFLHRIIWGIDQKIYELIIGHDLIYRKTVEVSNLMHFTKNDTFDPSFNFPLLLIDP